MRHSWSIHLEQQCTELLGGWSVGLRQFDYAPMDSISNHSGHPLGTLFKLEFIKHLKSRYDPRNDVCHTSPVD